MSRCDVSGGKNWDKPLKSLSGTHYKTILAYHNFEEDDWEKFLKEVGYEPLSGWEALDEAYRNYCILMCSPLGQALL